MKNLREKRNELIFYQAWNPVRTLLYNDKHLFYSQNIDE